MQKRSKREESASIISEPTSRKRSVPVSYTHLLLEAKLLRDNETKSGRRYKNSAVGPDGSFQMKIKPERSYILEISGDEGYGRVFLPAECLGEKVDISYPVKETIVIFHTNDRHFDFNHEDELVRTIEEARARYNDVFLFEAGDIFVRHASRWTVNDGQPNDTACLLYTSRCV